MPLRSTSRQNGARIEGDSKDVGAVLASSLIETYRVPVSKLVITTLGRTLRQAGVSMLVKSIEDDGWLGSSIPIVTLVDSKQENTIDDKTASDYSYRTIDGNHRVAALREMDKKKETDTIISVHVHRNLGEETERIIADREYSCQNTEVISFLEYS